MATIVYGSDFSCVTDLDFNLSLVDGRKGLAQAAARRLGTPNRGLFYDPEYGFSVLNLVNATVQPQIISTGIQDELPKDERINDCVATAELTGDVLTINAEIEDDDGPFDLTFEVSSKPSGEAIVVILNESI